MKAKEVQEPEEAVETKANNGEWRHDWLKENIIQEQQRD